MSRYTPDGDYRRSRHSRDYSPEYHSGGGGGSVARGYDQDSQYQQQQQYQPQYQQPFEHQYQQPQQQVPQALQVPQPPMQPPQPTSSPSQQQQPPRGLNESYYRESAALLGVPSPSLTDSRPQSVPPQSSAIIRRQRSPSRSSSRTSSRSYRGRGFDDDRGSRRSRSRSRAGSRSNETDTVGRARGVVRDNFSHTPAGIGAGLLGAVIGGIVANKASEAAFNHRHKTSGGGRARRYSDETGPRMVSTILGAVAGGLGANAVANKVEDSRHRGRNRQLALDGRSGREKSLPVYDSGRSEEFGYRNDRRNLYLEDNDYAYDDDRRSSHSRRSRRDGDDDDRYRY